MHLPEWAEYVFVLQAIVQWEGPCGAALRAWQGRVVPRAADVVGRAHLRGEEEVGFVCKARGHAFEASRYPCGFVEGGGQGAVLFAAREHGEPWTAKTPPVGGVGALVVAEPACTAGRRPLAFLEAQCCDGFFVRRIGPKAHSKPLTGRRERVSLSAVAANKVDVRPVVE